MSDGGAQANLTDEVLRVGELARALKERLLSRFIKEAAPKESDQDEGVEPNPIEYLIRKSKETQGVINACLELLEVQIINKLEGK